MNSKDESDSTKECPVDLELRIDKICDAFELSYQRNEQPRIEDYLDETVGEVETQLAELVMVELAYRKKAGDTPTFDEYVSRFPSYSNVLKQLSDHFDATTAVGYRTPPRIEGLNSFEFVGAGSFGAVWKAWDAKLQRFVAIKTPIRPIPTPNDRELVQREARIVARAKHPHVVPVHATGEADGRVYVIYEFVPGVNLRVRLEQESFTPRKAAALCAKIADAIHHVHLLGIVHRDLKPANILIDPSNEPHVMDFGLAKLVDATSTIGAAGNPLGTPAYMSPEQAVGSAETDARSDIYSLGVILFELLTGRPVFQGEREELRQKILSADPPAMSTLVPGIAPDLELICRQCLEKNKHDRYCTAGDLAADLRRYLNDERVKAHPVPRRVRGWRWIKRHRVPVLFAIVALLPLFAFLIPARQTPPPPPPGSRIVQVTTKPPGAVVTVLPCEPTTGEPQGLNNVALIPKAPSTLPLLPGRYLLHVNLMTPEGFLNHEVHRTVPDTGGKWPTLGAIWERSEVLPSGVVDWPTIELPPTKPLFEMVYIAGTDRFEIQGPNGPKFVSVSPFYVATREFTFGDFVRIRPGRVGNFEFGAIPKQPPHGTFPIRYDLAEQWAEESGCRLLTDLEFAYLAHLAHGFQSLRELLPDAPGKFDEAGGSTFDEIATDPPIRGILSGYAEWTSTWPSSPRATVNLLAAIDEPDHPELYRIIRGGTIDCAPGDLPRDQHTAAVSMIYKNHPRVGFRLARTPSESTPVKATK